MVKQVSPVWMAIMAALVNHGFNLKLIYWGYISLNLLIRIWIHLLSFLMGQFIALSLDNRNTGDGSSRKQVTDKCVPIWCQDFMKCRQKIGSVFGCVPVTHITVFVGSVFAF